MAPRLFIWIAFIGVLLSIPACTARQRVIGSGRIVGESYDFADFNQLIVHDTFDVTVLQGDGFAVEVSADDNLLEHVDVTQDGETLQIALSPTVDIQHGTLVAVVHLPRLNSADMHGVSRLRLESLKSDRLDLELNGASRVTGEVVAGQLHLELSGATRAELVGQADQLFAEVTGASQARLEKLTIAQRGTVEVNGASMAELHGPGELSLEANGSAKIRYAGAPTIVKSEANGASVIRPR